MRKESGFTLTELMVTIAIISVLSAIATPNVLQWMQSRKLTVGTQEILSALNAARFRAVKDNAHAIINFNTTQDSYRVFLDLNRNNRWDDGTDTGLAAEKMPAGISITEASFAGGASWIRFDGQGLPNGLGGHVVIVDPGGRMRQVVVNVTGRIQVTS